jgi:hypothetical protein
MIASFARQSVTRLRGTETTDRYGDPIVDWTAPDRRTIEPVTMTPIPGTETFDAAGRRLVTRWELHANSDADIRDRDRIEHNGTEYDIDGAVQLFPSPTGNLDHLEIMLKRVN